ncbi:hypothetical protein K1T71_004622 [Dendrolimus kikuchii]|uniref:Uncharacterized protein n=1 Tax=Dendrolimus kikuchii TaxID=765133 RepID=A0ACC1D8M2_9NEOP|nr:hypothetical protein K1T71_004622 [Dendrolimus kikuchii]
MAELPYQAEYAKTGRASCKGCKQKIDQGSLRIAIMVQSAFFDGKQPNWHHMQCFFKKQHPASSNDIDNFNKLTFDDQKKIKEEIASSALKDFKIEYSKSSRATCRHCEIKICKDEVRICKVVYDTEVGSKYGGQPLWHHVKCFAEEKDTLLYFAGGENLPGFNTLTKADQEMVKAAIKPLKSDEVPVKKLKSEPKDAEELKEDKKKEKIIEKQTKLFHKHRETLSGLEKPVLDRLLQENSQEIFVRRNQSLDHLADCMAFGALEPCPECKNGQLILHTFGYKCKGNLTAWTKCSYITQEPKRKPMIIPVYFKDDPVFKKYKPKTDVRLFQAAPPPVVIVKAEPSTSVKKEVPVPPMKNLQFFLYGKLKNKEETKKRILKLGGLIVSKLTDTTAAVITTKKDLERMPAKMQEIKDNDIEVVEESFLDVIDPENGTISKTLELIKEHNLAGWGSDPTKRVPQDILDGKSIPKSGSMYVKSSKSGPVKLKIAGGTAVDPASGLDDIAHVYKDNTGTRYTVSLSKTDVVEQKNSFYKMQVLEHNERKQYWLFRSWGRIGTTIGGVKVEPCNDLHYAIGEFEDMYHDKTNTAWDLRDNFVKVPGCYYPIDMDYGEDDSESGPLEIDSNSKLPIQVQKLVSMIFDIHVMKQTLKEFELDTEKMPLGKLSKNQIKSGYKVLSEILELIENGKATQSTIIDATNRFFTLIPHNFGVNNPPLLDAVEMIKEKTALLDNLLEIEIAYSLLKSDQEDDSVSPIEAHYTKLKTEITPLEHDSEEFALIEEYVRNTHAATHTYFTLKIDEIFKVVREGEDKRYKPFKKLHNRRLLWHGSRLTNFAGILSQGLRIAPPEAPVTGYMFGKGIYFADMVSKSASYCRTNQYSPIGLMLLCEVALGDMKECHQAENVKLPPGKHSAWGVGRTEPDYTQSKQLPDGTVVPLGKAIDKQVQTSLLYNEFIVYDVAQVNVKYLLQMSFNYSS